MKLHLAMFLTQIAKDAKRFYKNKNNLSNNLFLYPSSLIEKVELSIEMLFEAIYRSNKDKSIFDKKKFFVLVCELVKVGFQFKELQTLNNLGYSFYIDKNVYLENIIGLNEDELSNRIDSIDKENFLFVDNKKSSCIFKTTDKITIPNKISDLLKESRAESNKLLPSKINESSPGSKSLFKFLISYAQSSRNLIEILSLLRPLIYLSTMIIFKKRSFIPLLINMLIDFIVLSYKRHDDNFSQQKAFTHEYIYRIGRLGIYFLRQPIFSLITKPFIKKLLRVLRIPTVIVELISNLLSYYTNLYFIL